MKLFHVSTIMILLLVPGSCALGQDVRKAPSAMEGLSDRWNWALSQTGDDQFSQGGWIAYSIERLMGEDSYVGLHRTYSGKDEISLHELITGIHIENPTENLRETARGALSRSERRQNEKKVIKEVAFLFRFSDPASVENHIVKIQPTNINLSVELDRLPLIWLGKATTDESLRLLSILYNKYSSTRQKRRVIMAYGMHDSPKAFGLLRKVVEGDDPEDVRKDAVFWISQQNSGEALGFLSSVARNEKSQKVAEQAVFAISQIQTDDATDVLIDLGKNSPNRNLRKKAVFWLGQQASKKAVETLKDFAYESEDVEVQKQAVFALTQLDHGEGVTEIIKIAKSHANSAVRKQAIFWLGQSDDPRAFDTIVEIARGK